MGSPYIMPDGRPLAQYLNEDKLERSVKGSQKHRKAESGLQARWDKAGGAAPKVVTTVVGSQVEAADAEVVARYVGRERRRRQANERLLREMAGPLTALDMELMYKPPPFGETGYVTALAEIVTPENIYVWDLFRSIDMDKQTRVLQKWEAHIKELQSKHGSTAVEPAASWKALRAWANVSRKARDALKKTDPTAVDELELRFVKFVEEADQGGELVLQLEDGFHRLLAHGLAQYHDLASQSRPIPSLVTKEVVIRHKGASTVAREITCADILMALEDQPSGGINPKALKSYMLGNLPGHDSVSEASYVMV